MKNLHKNIGVFASSLLVTASAVYLYSPVIGTHADTTGSADINLNVDEVMSLTLDKNALNLNASPNSFVSGIITATSSTNSQYGYTLTLEDADGNTNMVHSNENISAVVTSNFDDTKTSATMDNNTWGFSLDATDFSKIPVNGSAVTIKRTTTPMTTENESTNITFGVKVGNITSGTYTDSVLFTIYTNGQGDPNGGETTMQGFDCSDIENVSDSMVLTDVRDGNEYTVKKLADGRCWMTENLRLIGTELNSETSDLPDGETWTITDNQPSEFDGYTYDDENYNVVYDHYDVNRSYLNETYGGFYTWYTATAGWKTGNADQTMSVENSPKSICPKGWKLPTMEEYTALKRSYTDSEGYASVYMQQEAPSFVLSGYIGGQQFQMYGNRGYYWSSTTYDGDQSYSVYIDATSIDTTNYYLLRSSGASVRCIAAQ